MGERTASEWPRRRLQVTPFTVAAWEPFGTVPADELDPASELTHVEFGWADPHINFIGHTYDEIDRTDTGAALCTLLNRHQFHTQALMAMNAEALVVVAPPGTTFESEADLDLVRAFVLPRHVAIVLRLGTWHWGPYPIAPGRVELFNVQGKRYKEDNGVAELTELLGVVLEVDTAAAPVPAST